MSYCISTTFGSPSASPCARSGRSGRPIGIPHVILQLFASFRLELQRPKTPCSDKNLYFSVALSTERVLKGFMGHPWGVLLDFENIPMALLEAIGVPLAAPNGPH